VLTAITQPVTMAFEPAAVRLPIPDIHPLRQVSSGQKKTAKFMQIEASVREVGLVEPPVVARDRPGKGQYLLLDGHLRLEILKDMGESHVVCLVSTDDEAFTYNRRINRIATIQEHRMILTAIERGVPEERLARALNLEVASLRQKRRLLEGICPEVVEMLKDRHVPINTFTQLKKMVPLRQIEAAELMVAMNKYAVNYAKSLLAATPQTQLTDAAKPKAIQGLSKGQMDLMERESANLDREFRLAEQTYGCDHLDLVLARGYLARLLGNQRVVRYLSRSHPEILHELQRIAEVTPTAA
jgi:hypothetical protein